MRTTFYTQIKNNITIAINKNDQILQKAALSAVALGMIGLFVLALYTSGNVGNFDHALTKPIHLGIKTNALQLTAGVIGATALTALGMAQYQHHTSKKELSKTIYVDINTTSYKQRSEAELTELAAYYHKFHR